MTAAPRRYSAIAMLLHWLIAAMLAFQLGMGRGLEERTIAAGLFDVTQLHKSIGITILLLSLARLGWRFAKPPPAPLPDTALNHRLSKLVHIGLYGFMIGAPLTGWLMVSTAKLDINTLLFRTVPWPDIPFMGALEAGAKAAINGAAEWAHGALGWAGVALFALHVIGALRHQMLRGEPLLARIWPGASRLNKASGALLIGGLVAILLALALWGQSWNGSVQDSSDTPLAASEAATQASGTLKSAVTQDTATAADEAPEEETDAPNEEAEKTVGDDPETATAPEAAAATAYDWRVTDKQPIGFSFGWNGDTVRGRFSDWRATIRFGAQALDQSSIDVSIGLASARTGESSVDEALPGADFFAIAANPQARFRSSDIRALGGNRYEARGTLSLRGRSQPVILRFTLSITGTTARAQGTATVNRAVFGIGEGNYGDLAETVTVSFDFAAER